MVLVVDEIDKDDLRTDSDVESVATDSDDDSGGLDSPDSITKQSYDLIQRQIEQSEQPPEKFRLKSDGDAGDEKHKAVVRGGISRSFGAADRGKQTNDFTDEETSPLNKDDSLAMVRV